MAGGIFTDRPFEANPKCIVIAMAAVILYWLVSCAPNYFLMPVIFIVVYIFIAWYDWFYSCKATMASGWAGLSNIDSALKPPGASIAPDDPRYGRLLKDQVWRRNMAIFTFHLIGVAPILLYVAARGPNSDPRVWPIVGVLGALAVLYHGIGLAIAA